MIGQKHAPYRIHGFALTASRRNKSVCPKRWIYLGLIQYLRHYPDNQLGIDGKVRKVWLFELRIHSEPPRVGFDKDAEVWSEIRRRPDDGEFSGPEDDEIVRECESDSGRGLPDLEASGRNSWRWIRGSSNSSCAIFWNGQDLPMSA